MEPVIPILFAAILVAVLIRLAAGGLDTDRIRAYVESRGGQLLEQQWTPFGRGWVGSANERIYAIRFRDADGREHRATVKTSAFAGVYLTEDELLDALDGEARPSRAELEAENRRLREELERQRSQPS